MFKKFDKFYITKNIINKKNNLYNQTFIIIYRYSKFEIILNLNNSKKIEKNLQIYNDKNHSTFYFYKNSIYKNNKKIFQSQINSFDNLYNILKIGNKKNIKNFKFHKNIFQEKKKILNKLKKI